MTLTIYQLPDAQQRLEVTESRQSQMMAFLSKALQNPGMLQQLVSSRQNIGRLENGTSSRGARELSLDMLECSPAYLPFRSASSSLPTVVQPVTSGALGC